MLIGQFARAARVSVRMLRHYDRIGLLQPDHVDADSGRRHYRAEQLHDLHRLLALKVLGFSLNHVGQMLQEGVSTDRLRELLMLRRTDLERQVREDQYRLARVEARLTMLGKDGSMTTHPIATKAVAPVHLAALVQDHVGRDRIGAGALVEPLFTRASDLADAAGISRLAPMGWYPADESGVQLHTGFVIDSHEAVTSDLGLVAVPAARVAALLHVGEMTGIAQTYAELQQWAGEQGMAGPFTWREVYLEADGQDQTDWIVEVQLELPDA